MGTRQVLALGSAAFGALAALNSALAAPPPPAPPIAGQPQRFRHARGDVYYTVSGSGPAVVLVHGPGVAASSFEMRYIAEPLARGFRVYSLDLLGFGHSERPRIPYDAQLYRSVIGEFLRLVVGGDARIVASGLSGAYCLALAAEHPDMIASLVLSAPPPPDGSAEAPTLVGRAADIVLGMPVLGQSLFNALITRNGIRAYLRDRAYSNPELVTESMVDAYYATAHQPYARRACQAFLAGRLHLDVRAALAAVRQPLLVVFGGDARQAPGVHAAAYARLNPRAQVLLLDRCRAFPHEEQAERFAAAAAAWLHPQGQPIER